MPLLQLGQRIWAVLPLSTQSSCTTGSLALLRVLCKRADMVHRQRESATSSWFDGLPGSAQEISGKCLVGRMIFSSNPREVESDAEEAVQWYQHQ